MTDSQGLPFNDATRRWFREKVGEPTAVQTRGWAAIARGAHSLLLAPTGSGKTLAAFLYGIDRLAALDPVASDGVRLLYVSPLKALVYDIEKNLRRPLAGITALRGPGRELRVNVRTGDTSQRDRRQQRRRPADILVTTPESLFLILTSGARETLRSVETVIVDEIHVMASSKRGTHLALSLERLSEIADRDPQRIGLSATVRPPQDVAQFLGGDRAVEVVDTSSRPNLDLQVVVPVPDMTHVEVSLPGPSLSPGSSPGRHESGETIEGAEKGIWAAIYPRLIELIRANTSTLIFVNTRGACERLTRRLNDLAGEDLVQAHHGSVSHDRRAWIEEQLKNGQLRALVATSSLELGIDMGAIDLVVNIESPKSVSRGLQRVGRAGHQVGAASVGRIFPKYRGDLLEAATVAHGMTEGAIEPMHVPENVLDVLAQQLVALCVDDERTVEGLYALVCRAHPYRNLPREGFLAVLEMLAGRYPSNELADLRPRLVWDRERDVVRARKGARMVTLLNAGTIPDRGLFRVQLGTGGPKVGELDEEMVYESKVGDTFALGASTWKVEEITHDRVIVSPAPGEMGRLPFWRGEGVGRPIELGERQGRLLRAISERETEAAVEWLRRELPLNENAARNLATFVHDQLDHAGVVPNDQVLLAERFRDELGDWRVCLLSPFGGRVHAPLAIAARAKLAARTGVEVEVSYNDDGLIWRTVDMDELPDVRELLPAADEVEHYVTEHLRRSAMFASMFRENAGRSLLLTRRSADGRNPLWSQRLKAKSLLGVVQRYPRFPIVLETYRQCLQDIFDLPGLRRLLGRIEEGEVRIESRETTNPSPFATSVVFEHQAQYLYEVDAPAAETRARALALDRSLLRELLGSASERSLVDREVMDEVEARLQRTHHERRARDVDQLHDVFREVGVLNLEGVQARSEGSATQWLEQLEREGRIVSAPGRGWIAAEVAELYAAALDWPVGEGALELDEDERDDPVGRLVEYLAARRGPFTLGELAAEVAVPHALLAPVLERLVNEGRLISGELRPDGDALEWCDPDVWRRMKRVTLARLREAIEPASASELVRFLVDHQGLAAPKRGIEGLERVLEQLEGLSLPWSVWLGTVLPMRVSDFRPDMLDALCSGGAWVWQGRGALGRRDGRIAFYRRTRFSLLLPELDRTEPTGFAAEVLAAMPERGALFASDLVDLGAAREIDAALLSLAWGGWVRNDTVAPLLRAGSRSTSRSRVVRSADGRWSKVRFDEDSSSTQRAFERASLLLERYGVVTAETAQSEGIPGGFSAIYDVLREMEERGQVRRGYFIRESVGAQFSTTAAVDALRNTRAKERVIALAATDPAQPHGALVPWPDRYGQPRRKAGAYVLFVEGRATAYLSANLRDLMLLGAPSDFEEAMRWLATHRLAGSKRTVAIDTIDGKAARSSLIADRLEAAGWSRDHRGFVAP